MNRTASSIWLPWIAGLLAFLSIAAATAVFGGRTDGGVAVPDSVLEMHRTATETAAIQIRNGLDGAVQDLAQLAGSLATAGDATAMSSLVGAFAGHYGRYRAVFVIDEAQTVLAQAGGDPHTQLAPQGAQSAGMTDAIAVDNLPIVLQYAPFTWGGRALLVAGEYDLAKLRYALDPLSPATSWLVNSDAQIIASTAGFVAFESIAAGDLSEAAHSTSDQAEVGLSQQGLDAGTIIAQVPVRGGDATAIVPAWRLVVSRSVGTIALPGVQARNQALLVGLAIAIVTVGIFGWIYVMWLLPVRRLVYDAERIAQGDLRDPVEVRRYDELGLAAAALERIRVGAAQQAPRYPYDHMEAGR